jgi:hypothetical protein
MTKRTSPLLSMFVVVAISFAALLPSSVTSAAQAPARMKAIDLIAKIPTAAELPRAGYDRALFRHWIDIDGDGCDTRAEVLIAEATKAPSIRNRCTLVGGQWVSIYDDATTTRASSFDVDHVVALAEAWDSGASRWDGATRKAFANDLDSSYSLVAVSASSNRAKSDSDFSGWKPSTIKGRCWLATATVVTKWRWSLTMDRTERDALSTSLARCPSSLVLLPERARVVTTSTTPSDAPIPTPTASSPVTTQPMPDVSSTPKPLPSTTASPQDSVTVSLTPDLSGNCPPTHPVKGNIGASGNIYHTPDSSWYERTKAEICFRTTRDAAEAGFRAPLG